MFTCAGISGNIYSIKDVLFANKNPITDLAVNGFHLLWSKTKWDYMWYKYS